MKPQQPGFQSKPPIYLFSPVNHVLEEGFLYSNELRGLLREMLHIVPNHIMDHTKLMLFKWMETGYSGDRSNLLLVIRYLFVDSLIYLCLKYTNPTNPIGIDAREGGGCHSRALISLPPDNICLVS